MINIGQYSNNGEYFYTPGLHSNFDSSTYMPKQEEILAAFEEVLKKMDLPPDKMRTLRDCDLKKKWDLVCDQRRMHQTQTVTHPNVYLEKLAIYLDKKRSKKKKKLIGNDTSTAILRHIEISLRTNSIDWVCQFLNSENNGLQILVEYLSQLQESYSDATENVPSTSTASLSFANASGFHSNEGNDRLDFSIPNLNQLKSGNTNSFLYYPNSSASLNNANFDDNTSMTSSIGVTTGSQVGSLLFRNNTLNNLNGSFLNKSVKLVSKQITDSVEDDVHVCVSCLRALMNNKFGLNMVLNNKKAIYCIVRSICHHSLRTKALAIDLLSAICMLKDGHELVLDAFNCFRIEFRECFRFQTLFNYFVYSKEFHFDFMISCIKFINVIVHSTEDRNQRVALQYEFTVLGLHEFLERLLREDIDELLARHVYSYQNNLIDVDTLMQESNHRLELLDQVSFLEQEISRQRERVQEVEADYIARNALLNKRLLDLINEKQTLENEKNKKDLAIHTLTRDFCEREQQYNKDKLALESRIQELELTQREIQEGLKLAQKTNEVLSASSASSAITSTDSGITTNSSLTKNYTKVPSSVPSSSSSIHPPQISLSIPTPPPPPPQLFNNSHKKQNFRTNNGPPPPPPPPMLLTSNKVVLTTNKQESASIKKIASTKCKLPMFNWSALNSNQVKGTVFNDLNDEKLIEALDLSFLENMFKLGNGTVEAVGSEMTSSTSTNATNASDNLQMSPDLSNSAGNVIGTGKLSLLGTKRLQNVAITRRKLAKPVAEIMSAVHRFDLTVLSQENVDILIPIVPTNEEVQQYKEYLAKNNSLDGLTLEDQFLAQLMNIERLTQKLTIMSFMGGFEESYNLLIPQIQKVTAASKSVREATSFHKIIEIILAVGNAMNGSRRSPIYGFKLSSLDSLVILKSQRDRSVTLMHVIADIVVNSFPELLNISEQMKFVESAAGVNLETINADVHDIESKFNKAVAEQNRKGEDNCPQALNTFITNNKPKIQILREGLKISHDTFIECSEYYGETGRNIQANAFFTRLASFLKHFEQAVSENEARRVSEQRQIAEQERKLAQQKRRAINSNNNVQNQLVNELNNRFLESIDACEKNSKVNTKTCSKLDSSQIKDGDFERIMHGLKDGYVALDNLFPIPVKRRVGDKSLSPNRYSQTSNSMLVKSSSGITKEVQRDRAQN